MSRAASGSSSPATVSCAPAGSFVLIPPEVPHERTARPRSRWFHLFSPPGIERWFVERERMREAGATADAIDAASRRYGVRTAPRPPAAIHAVIPDAPTERRVLADGSHTKSAYGVTEYADVLWRDPQPPHRDEDADESLYVAAGEFEVQTEGRSIRVVPGTFVFMPRGVVQAVRELPGASARYIAIRSPA